MSDRIADALYEALDNIEFILDAASVDYETGGTPNTNQYEIYYGEGSRVATLTADEDETGEVCVWGEIATADGEWIDGGLAPDDIAYIITVY